MASSAEAPAHFQCANKSCTNVGGFSCKRCLLVLYCGQDCQRSHWQQHKTDCKSALLKPSWRPQWDIQDRTPVFCGGRPDSSFDDNKKFLWGRVPAYDVLNLEANEGSGITSDLDLLFAASGDLRNVLKTIESLPPTYGGEVRITMNDEDLDVVVRNVLILLLLVYIPNPQSAAQGVIHLWYSAFIPQALQDVLAKAHGVVQSLCTASESAPPEAPLIQEFLFDKGLIRVALQKKAWFSMLDYLKPSEISLEEAKELRKAVTLAAERIDYRERAWFRQSPSARFCSYKFREDGVLLPFSAARDAFILPNPTIFVSGSWPLADSADPLDGWALGDVKKTDSGAATNDIYGKLYYHLLGLLSSVHGRLRDTRISIQMKNECIRHFFGDTSLQKSRFDRIETANMADTDHLGVAYTVCALGSLLKKPEVNPHATLITLFMNAVPEMTTLDDKISEIPAEIHRVNAYMAISQHMSRNDARFIRLFACREMVRDYEKYFERYMQMHFKKFRTLLKIDMEMKPEHTIIGQWPLRLKKRPGEPGAVKEFAEIMESGHIGHQRYVEWRLERS
ncbi:putative MYND-type zinc finger protein samB [Seiridium cardinale]